MKVFRTIIWVFAHLVSLPGYPGGMKKGEIRVLLIDGQNNHKNMFDGSKYMKQILEESGLFKVDIVTTPPAGGDMTTFQPDFAPYDVVMSTYNGEPWTEKTNRAFEKFVADG